VYPRLCTRGRASQVRGHASAGRGGRRVA
jgi:hypothetical protein